MNITIYRVQKIGPYLLTRGESIFITLYTQRSFNKTTVRYAHPTLENERKTLEVFAAVFGGGSENIADGQREESIGMVIYVSGN